MNEVLKPIEELGETPEEFKVTVWRTDFPGTGARVPCIRRKSTEPAAWAAISADAGRALLVACGVSEQYLIEVPLQSALTRAHGLELDLALVDTSLTEVRRWEYKP